MGYIGLNIPYDCPEINDIEVQEQVRNMKIKNNDILKDWKILLPEKI